MAVINDFTNICGDACTSEVVFPAVSLNPDCDPQLFKSQLGDLIIVPEGAPDPITGWAEGATVSVTAAAIDNAGVDNTTSRRLGGIGSLGEFEDSTVPGRYGKQITLERVAPLEFIVQDVSDANYAFAKVMQCSPSNFTAYLGNVSHLFGQEGGMALRNLKVQMPLGAGEDDYEQIIIRAEVVSTRVSPERTANNPFV